MPAESRPDNAVAKLFPKKYMANLLLISSFLYQREIV